MPKDGVTQYIQPWNDWYSDRTIYYPLPVKEVILWLHQNLLDTLQNL